MRARTAAGVVLLLLGGAAAAVFVVRLAAHVRGDVARCPQGLEALGARCCGAGQRVEQGICRDRPRSCAAGMLPAQNGEIGCVARPRRVRIAGGIPRAPAGDWQGAPAVPPPAEPVAAFVIDATEVSAQAWRDCAASGVCRAIAAAEPGTPATGISAEEASRFCEARGGRLPTGGEWLLAAAGTEGRRFAWGMTGLVCRRAAFGLVDGPCASGGIGPELGGSRPDGATPEGVLDLSGNVAEWTREPAGWLARGGSFRSSLAGELTTTAAAAMAPGAEVGFRCAYDAGE